MISTTLLWTWEKWSLQTVLWADRRLRSNYTLLNDGLLFNITYKTNKFKLSFSPNSGVNHHSLWSLLEDEIEVTFI